MITAGPAAARSDRLPAVASQARWKMGLDLGAATTVYEEVFGRPGFRAMASSATLPTLLAYPRREGAEAGRAGSVAIGEEAVIRRSQLEVVAPLAVAHPRRVAALLDFARALRQEMAHARAEWPWGVVSCPVESDADRRKELRAAAGELFEKLLVVEEPILHALALLEDPLAGRALVVDLGHTSLRASVVGGLADPSGAEDLAVAVPQGGAWVDEHLRALLLQKYSDLVLTEMTVSRMKEQLGFVEPARKSARVKLLLGKSHRVIDVTEMVRDACEAQVPAALKAILAVVSRVPREEVDGLMESIHLVGGGGATPGLAERLEAELRREGLDRARVHRPRDPRGVLAHGALRLALLTEDPAWEEPLFAFQGV